MPRGLGAIPLLETAAPAGREPFVLGAGGDRRADCECGAHARCEALHRESARIAVDIHRRVDRRCQRGSIQPLRGLGLTRIGLKAANRLERRRRRAPALQRRERNRARQVQLVVVWLLTKEGLERLERLVRPASPSQHGHLFANVPFVAAEARFVLVQVAQGRAVVPAPPFCPCQLDPDHGRARLDAQVTLIRRNGRVRIPCPGTDPPEAQHDLEIVRHQLREALIGISCAGVIAVPRRQRPAGAEDLYRVG